MHCVGRIYSNSVRTSQETHYVCATKPNRLLLFREIIADYCENHTEHINDLKKKKKKKKKKKWE
jgi:predicted Zn-dependent protease with MMP-like domain